jgi:hypothetical protein
MREDEQDRPLISERSPSYARARHEREHPAATADPDEIAVLNRLVEAEAHAAAICAAAVEVLSESLGAPDRAEIVADLCALHEEHVHGLGDTIAELGASAPRPDERERVLSRDPADIHYLQDTAEVLAAVSTSEDELAARYRDALARAQMPATAQTVLARHRDANEAQHAELRALMRGETRF